MSAAWDDDASDGRSAEDRDARPDAAETSPARAAQPRDASFEDAYRPMRLAARDAEDLKVVSALLQDAVTTSDDIAFLSGERRFAMVLNRFRWEEPEARERVRAGVHFDGVLGAKVKGFDPKEKARPFNLLAIDFEAAETAPAGVVRIVFAGDAEVALQVDALDAALADMTRPWPATATPRHRG